MLVAAVTAVGFDSATELAAVVGLLVRLSEAISGLLAAGWFEFPAGEFAFMRLGLPPLSERRAAENCVGSNARVLAFETAGGVIRCFW